MAQQDAVSVETLKAIANAFNAHDLDAIMEFFADDCSLDMPRGPDSASQAKWPCARGWRRASKASRTSTTVMIDTGSVAMWASPSGC
jgi:ketosteroid isomerase-like protein